MIQSQYFKSVMDSIWSLSCAVDPQAALAQVANHKNVLLPCTYNMYMYIIYNRYVHPEFEQVVMRCQNE